VSLARLFYADHGWPEDFTDGKPIEEQQYKLHEPFRILRYLLKNFRRSELDKLEYGSIVVLKIYGELHLGIYINYGKILCMQVPVIIGYSKSTVYRQQWWSQFFLCAFSRKT
jgi:hypothetical protein